MKNTKKKLTFLWIIWFASLHFITIILSRYLDVLGIPVPIKVTDFPSYFGSSLLVVCSGSILLCINQISRKLGMKKSEFFSKMLIIFHGLFLIIGLLVVLF